MFIWAINLIAIPTPDLQVVWLLVMRNDYHHHHGDMIDIDHFISDNDDEVYVLCDSLGLTYG